jgi:hypothetical protein
MLVLEVVDWQRGVCNGGGSPRRQLAAEVEVEGLRGPAWRDRERKQSRARVELSVEGGWEGKQQLRRSCGHGAQSTG